jgi:rsbT antagonist protein RsbS
MARESISVIKVREKLLVTVPPDPDDETVITLQEKTLQTMTLFDVKGLVLDISTVETLDSYFARTIVETSEMVKLMGGRTVIAGMKPNVAITATQLGLSFDGLLTSLDVDLALEILEDD